MTDNRETIEMLKMLKEQALKSRNDTVVLGIKIDSFNFFLDEAIKALEQKPCDMKQRVEKEYLYESLCEDLKKANAEIKRLSEPCEDCISRAKAIEEADKLCLETGYDNEKVIEMLNALPPVNPQEQKIGHWIPVIDRWGDMVTTLSGYKCDKCKAFNPDKDSYCPNCGAKMVEPQESEEVRNDSSRVDRTIKTDAAECSCICRGRTCRQSNI